jgi:cell wall-associated NlpC family hydrolase
VTHIEDVLLWAVAQDHKRYIFGTEVSAATGDPKAFDCSELVEWSCNRAKVTPAMPDGAVNQYAHCRNAGTTISIGEARRTRGALLFSGPGFTGGRTGRTAIHHVAFSLGNDTTIEARGTKWGVGCWSIGTRFNFAARIPGVDYSPGHRPFPPQEDDLPLTDADLDKIIKGVAAVLKTEGVSGAADYAALAAAAVGENGSLDRQIKEIRRAVRG